MVSLPSTKSTLIAVFLLGIIVIILYAIDLFEFNMDNWDLHTHIPPIHLIMANKTNNILAHLDNIANKAHPDNGKYYLERGMGIMHNLSKALSNRPPPSDRDDRINQYLNHLSEEQSESKLDPEPDTDHHQHIDTPTTFSQLFDNPHHIINGNPFKFDECRNAILHKENINIKDFLWEHTQHLNRYNREQLQQNSDAIIWSREFIQALNNSNNFGHLVRVRMSYDANNPEWKGSRARHPKESIQGYKRENRPENLMQLAYFHISKCGSSSIHNMLKDHYNTTRMYWRDLMDIDNFPVIPDIDCAFTFIRHPIDRIISGYYTVLSMLNREFSHKANGNETLKDEIIREYGESHPWFNYNGTAKERFRLFVTEILRLGYDYVQTDHLMLHVLTQIGSSIGVFHNWPIHFMGRMEYFEEHWYVLSMEHEKCSPVFENALEDGGTHDYKLAHSMKRMGHQNSIDSHDVDGDIEKKEEMKKKGLSAEHFVFIEDKELFKKTVDYFYQDFVCFNYNMTHEGYIKHLNDKYYI